ncbi:hypothetical protein [Acinetobacter indicus]|jgi:hypothetical protein|uniref:hypothetical protein n=1 Tax=Acinetobacter indicus TaxID=756892 RepID=UPI0032B5250E
MKKISLIIIPLILSGCSFFEPQVELTKEELLKQYQFQLSEITDVDLIKSVKSLDCKFLGYVEPDFKSTPTFGCIATLEPYEAEKYDDVKDEVLLARHGINGKTTHLEKSKFIESVSEQVFKQSIKVQ